MWIHQTRTCLKMCVCVCACMEMHRSAVLEEKQDTASHLILSHVLCILMMSGCELDSACVCVREGVACRHGSTDFINAALSPARSKMLFICVTASGLQARGDIQGLMWISPGNQSSRSLMRIDETWR